MAFLIIFIIIPLIEIAVFIQAGEVLGLGYTLLLCLLTAVIGGFLVKKQGLETLIQGRKTLDKGAMPLEQLFDGLCIVIAGAMMITPGFVTDIAGFLLLIPGFRTILRGYAVSHFEVATFVQQNYPRTQQQSTDIEGEYEKIDERDKA